MVKNTQRGASWSVFLQRYYLGHQIKETEMDGACSTYGIKQWCMQDFNGEA